MLLHNAAISQKAVEVLGDLDVIVLNHGIHKVGFWEGNNENMSNLQEVMQTTFTSHVIIASDALPYLERRNGSMAVVSSIHGRAVHVIHCFTNCYHNVYTSVPMCTKW